MAMTRSCGLTTIADFLATTLNAKPDAMRERLRDEYREATAQKGQRRQTLPCQECFAPLLAWILSWWHGERRLERI